jgi:hypothetical protein
VDEETRPSDSPLIARVWRARSDRPGKFISQASTHWEMVLTRHQGQTTLTVRGPETKATPALIPPDAQWLGITFSLGAFMPCFPPGGLLDLADIVLPGASSQSFWLGGSAWEFPTYDNADTFVLRLGRAGLLTYDPAVMAALRGEPVAYSPRALQYRFLSVTGLTQNKIRQIERARRAAALLEAGAPILDTAHAVGYFDQSHLTNALRRFMGQTPAQLLQLRPTA